MDNENKTYTGIPVIDDYLNGGESLLKTEVVLNTNSLLLPICAVVAGVALIIVLKKKIK